MQLREAIAAAGMMPPSAERLLPGRWIRFPGAGKKRSNRAGWCRLITPTLAIFGDFSTGLKEIWKDDAHRGSEDAKRLLAEAQQREREFLHRQAVRIKTAEQEAQRWLNEAHPAVHPYLMGKGFPETLGLVRDEELLVPMRAVEDYRRLLNVQRIAADGTKRFLAAARAKGAIHVLGFPKPDRRVLCEGYATGLTLQKAFERLPGRTAVVVCFSAGNLVAVAPEFPGATVCADHDQSRTGELAARKTGLKWLMPQQEGEDFNDLQQRAGLMAVIEAVREICA